MKIKPEEIYGTTLGMRSPCPATDLNCKQTAVYGPHTYSTLGRPGNLHIVAVAQVTNGPIMCYDVYPGQDQFLYAAGDEIGESTWPMSCLHK